MADDVVTLLNAPVATLDKEELEEATFNGTPLNKVALEVNVSQRLCEEDSSRKVVRTQIDRSAWDR
jgi:hypothetical protein